MSTIKDVSHRSFRSKNGDAEHFMTITAPANLTMDEQIAFLHERHTEAMKTLGLKQTSTIFKRFFVSDAINGSYKVYRSPLFADTRANPIAITLVQQPPLPLTRIAMFAYHIETSDTLIKERFSPHHVIVEKNDIRHMWSTQLCSGFLMPSTQEELQTREVLNGLVDTLSRLGSSFKDSCLRTWIYIKNVDILYQGMVKSRREIFEREGLTETSHYVASTGIEGCCDHPYDFVSMDAYSILNLDKLEVSYLNDFDYLCSTKEYNVTFERGTRVAYQDRAHLFISGTASIDNLGQTLHHGDVMKQLDRTLENIGALLKAGGATPDDLMYMFVYLRDPNDYERVSAILRERFPETPLMFVQGAVCRPEWLVEIEGFAIITNDSPKLRPF